MERLHLAQPVAQAELAGLACLFFAHPVSFFALVYRQYPWSGQLWNFGDCALYVCVQLTCSRSVETALRSKGCIRPLCENSTTWPQQTVFRDVRAGNHSGLTHLPVASSQRVDAAALAKLARRFGEEATEELLLSTVLHVRQRLGLIRRWRVSEREREREREGGRGSKMPVLRATFRHALRANMYAQMRVAQYSQNK